MLNEKELNCLEVCRLLSADPVTKSDAIKKHLVSCTTCSSYAEQQLKLSNSLQQALNISAPEGLASRILLQQSINEDKQSGFRRNRMVSIAASVVLSISVFSGLVFINSPTSLEQLALDHVKDELHHLQDDKNIQLAELNSVLQPFNMKLNSILGKINYAGSCQIRNSKGVHIVVQSKSGPVTLLVMPGELITHRKLVNDVQFSGSVVPINNGSIAIIGGNPESQSEIEQRFKNGISYI